MEVEAISHCVLCFLNICYLFVNDNEEVIEFTMVLQYQVYAYMWVSVCSIARWLMLSKVFCIIDFFNFQHLDVAYVIHKLRRSRAFVFTAMPKHVSASSAVTFLMHANFGPFNCMSFICTWYLRCCRVRVSSAEISEAFISSSQLVRSISFSQFSMCFSSVQV